MTSVDVSSLAIEVDTSELRSGTDSPPSKIQQKLETWSPRPSDSRSFCGKIDGATERRNLLVEARMARTARRNARASEIARSTKEREAEATNAKNLASAAKLGSAEQKRKACLSATVASAASHVERAKEIAAEQRVLKQQKLHDQKVSLQSREQAATRRVLFAAKAMQTRLANMSSRAAAAADTKATRIETLKAANEAKLVAADARREELEHQKLSKLGSLAERAKQVRRNKGSTPEEEEVKTRRELAVKTPPPAFDMAVRGPATLSPQKSPVQLRLEARLAQPPSPTKTLFAQAVARRLSLVEEKTTKVAEHNSRAKEVAAAVAAQRQDESAAALAKSLSKVAVATARRGTRLNAETEKHAAHVAQATSISASIKAASEAQLAAAKLAASASTAGATQRKLEVEKSKAQRAVAFAQPWSPARKNGFTYSSVAVA